MKSPGRIRAARYGLIAAAALVVATTGCRSNEPRTGDIPRLESDAADTSHPKYLSGASSTRLWVMCGDSHYDLRDMSLDLPAPLPIEFPGAPSKTASGAPARTELCGVDIADRKTAFYTSTLDAAVIRDYYVAKLPARGCKPTEEPATEEWAVILRFECPSGNGTIRVDAKAGAFQIAMDAIPENMPPTPPIKSTS